MGSQAAKYLFYNTGLRRPPLSCWAAFNLAFAPDKDFFFSVGQLDRSRLTLGAAGSRKPFATGGIATVSRAHQSARLPRRRIRHRSRARVAQFPPVALSLGDCSVPLLIYFLGPQLRTSTCPADASAANAGWLDLSTAVWRYIVRPVAIGGMMVGTGYTLFRMRKNLFSGLAKAFAEVRSRRPRNGIAQPYGALHAGSRVVLGLLGVHLSRR